MGVLRTSILLISVALEVGGLLAAMVAGEGLLQIDAVSTSIKPYYLMEPIVVPRPERERRRRRGDRGKSKI